MHDTIKILLADDHPVFRAGVRALLDAEPDLKVVAEAGTGEEAVAMARTLRPRVVVIDAAMSRFDGADAIRRIVAEAAGVRVLVLVMNALVECRRFALDSGASGCLSKLRADRELVDALRTIARGGVYFSASDAIPVPATNGGGDGAPADPVSPLVLSDRERQVVRLTASGYSSREIGEQLAISSKTVDTYRARSMEKLGFSHRWELVRYALRNGLLAGLWGAPYR